MGKADRVKGKRIPGQAKRQKLARKDYAYKTDPEAKKFYVEVENTSASGITYTKHVPYTKIQQPVKPISWMHLIGWERVKQVFGFSKKEES